VTPADLAEARQLYDAAERDWEFYDASAAFCSFMHWLEDNFLNLLKAVAAAQQEEQQ
jgi:hypothetical protein